MNNIRVLIRDETPLDVAAITAITIAAFALLEVSGHNEQHIINALRAKNALSLSLVAEWQGCLVGHIAFSPVEIVPTAAKRNGNGSSPATASEKPLGWYGLGPVSVLPMYQKRGVGKALINEGMKRLRAAGANGCCLVGHPTYYPQFGFRTVPGLVYEGVPAEVFMACSFDGAYPQGQVIFHEAFQATNPS